MKLKITNLYEYPHLRKKTINMIEKSFGYNYPNNFEVDFYPLIKKENSKNNYIMINDQEDIIGHIGYTQRILMSHKIKTPVTFLGGIAISEQHRGNGYFKKLFNYVLETTSNSTCLYFLWSDLVEIYKKFNFFLGIGLLQKKCVNHNGLKSHDYKKIKFKDLRLEEKKDIINLYNQNHLSFLTVQRKNHHWLDIEDIKSSDLFIKKDSNNKIESYYFIHKGQDLQNIIHEMGNLNTIETDFFSSKDNSFAWLPESLQLKHNFDFDFLYLALIKIGNFNYFKNFISSWSNYKIQIINNNLELIKFKLDMTIYEMPISEFICSCFGPYPDKELAQLGPSIYIGGLDSI